MKTYGQTPRQLFTSAHPNKLKSDVEKLKSQEKCETPVFETAKGLKWGAWCGSPSLPLPSPGRLNYTGYVQFLDNLKIIQFLKLK